MASDALQSVVLAALFIAKFLNMYLWTSTSLGKNCYYFSSSGLEFPRP